ncbi:MAG: hypothetical protein VX427_18850 [Acidobacteriota bacterium]|nr:hypothetical protein [Acidobacteriota bacterium]
MSDPAQRNDAPATTVGGEDRAAKIEQLLQFGLDHYVQGQFDRAVDVWTRVLFLDRTHAGARAHIGRARAAMAERLRESEALLHAGVDACERGQAVEARALLTKAIQHGGANDEVLAALDRVERLGAVGATASGDTVRLRGRVRHPRRDVGRVAPRRPRRRLALWLLPVPLVMAAAGTAYIAGGWASSELGPIGARPRGVSSMSLESVDSLPVPSVPELALRRAETLADEGRLSEALGVLATVGRGAGVGQGLEALRGQLQRRLLEGVTVSDRGTVRSPDAAPTGRPTP